MRASNRRGLGERSQRPVWGSINQASGVLFETDLDITDTPTQYIDLDKKIEVFELTEVYWRLNPTNLETYRLMLFEGATVDDRIHELEMVFDSGIAMVGNQAYRETESGPKLPVIVNLVVPGRLYLATDWTGPPGNTEGVLGVKGYCLVGETS